MISYNLLEETGVYAAEEFNSAADFTQTKSSTTFQLCKECIKHTPPIPETRKTNFSLIRSKRESASKSMLIDLYPELRVRFNLKINSVPVFEEQRWMYHSQVSNLVDPFL